MSLPLFLIVLGLLGTGPGTDAPAAAAAPAPGTAASAGPLCPKGGPHEGAPPPILILPPGGARLGVCADDSPGPDGSLGGSEISIVDFRDPAAPAVIWTGNADPNRYRVEVLGESAVRVRLDALLPQPGGPYAWIPFSSVDVACRGGSCRAETPVCVLALTRSADRDETARVRQGAETGIADAQALDRLTDDIAVQALAGDERAGWLLDHFQALFHLGKEGAENLAQARDLLKQARDLGCPGLVSDAARGSAPAAPAGDAILHPVPRDRTAPRSADNGSEPAPGIGVFSWLVGGRWEGRGAWSNGAPVHVEESYEWGPARRTVRVTSWNLSGDTRARLYDGLLFHDDRRHRFMLWSIRGTGGFAEAEIPRADFLGYEIEDAGTRSVITRAGKDGYTWSLRTRQDGAWKETLITTYHRLSK
jgi:hypothetical protein